MTHSEEYVENIALKEIIAQQDELISGLRTSVASLERLITATRLAQKVSVSNTKLLEDKILLLEEIAILLRDKIKTLDEVVQSLAAARSATKH